MRIGALQTALRAVRSQTASLLDRSLCSLLDKVSGTAQVAIGQRQEYKKSHVMCDFFVYVKILL